MKWIFNRLKHLYKKEKKHQAVNTKDIAMQKLNDLGYERIEKYCKDNDIDFEKALFVLALGAISEAKTEVKNRS